jgi:hypothetical protein
MTSPTATAMTMVVAVRSWPTAVCVIRHGRCSDEVVRTYALIAEAIGGLRAVAE